MQTNEIPIALSESEWLALVNAANLALNAQAPAPERFGQPLSNLRLQHARAAVHHITETLMGLHPPYTPKAADR